MAFFEFRLTRNMLLAGGRNPSIAEQLALFLRQSSFGFEATDERDKIYGILGLLSTSSLPYPLQPNYHRSPGQVFWDYAVYILKHTRCLDVLSYCSASKLGVPSWVPDWQRGIIAGYIRSSKTPHLRFLAEDRKIEVDCMVLSTIKKVIDPVDIPATFGKTLFSKQRAHRFSCANSQIVSAYERTRTFNIGSERSARGVRDETVRLQGPDAGLEPWRLQQWIESLSSGYGKRRGKNDFETVHGMTRESVYNVLMKFPNPALNTPKIPFTVASFAATVKETMAHARYEEESGISGVPKDASIIPKPGDMICYLRNSFYKFILRPENEEWRLIGLAASAFYMTRKEVESEDTTVWNDFWDANKERVKRIIIH